MLVRQAMALGLSPEEMRAWSQNLGYADVLTSYGEVPTHRHGEIIRGLGARNGALAGVVSRRQMEVLERVRAHEERVQSSADRSVTKMRLFD